nr:Gp49 family protein [uncultured Cohaesibacter sp.]
MDDQTIEREIQAKGLTAPRITPNDIEACIASEHYFTALGGAVSEDAESKYDGKWEVPKSMQSLGLLTFCVLVLRDGFTVTGESACASPENFNAEIGRKIARQNAVQKIWPLEGYRLRCQLAETSETTGYAPHEARVLAERKELDEKLTKLHAFLSSDKLKRISTTEIEAMTAQAEYMGLYLSVLDERISRFKQPTE